MNSELTVQQQNDPSRSHSVQAVWVTSFPIFSSFSSCHKKTTQSEPTTMMNNWPPSVCQHCCTSPLTKLLDELRNASIVEDNPRTHSTEKAISCPNQCIVECRGSKDFDRKQRFDRWMSIEISPTRNPKKKSLGKKHLLPTTPSLRQLSRRRHSWPTKHFDRWSPDEEAHDDTTPSALHDGTKDDLNARLPRRKPSGCLDEGDEDCNNDNIKTRTFVGSALTKLDWGRAK